MQDSWHDVLTRYQNAPRDSDLAGAVLTCAERTPLSGISNDEWRRFLSLTGRSQFLTALPDDASRRRWADRVFDVLQHTQFSLLDLFEERARQHPRRILFQDMASASRWSYDRVRDVVREIATLFLSENENPRVAIFSENSIESACCDLACLFYGLFVSPLNTHMKPAHLQDIFQQLRFDIAITDSPQRLKILLEFRQKNNLNFKIWTVGTPFSTDLEIRSLGQARKALDLKAIDQRLNSRPRPPLTRVATTMFTSGSTGQPKGVSFSYYHLIAKRFARAAALPRVGDAEVLLCYLPLYHTFGRFFEMLGAIYWRGTYVFTGNPSAETLLALFPKINPTGFISVPVRWVQLYEAMGQRLESDSAKSAEEALRQVAGNRLKWGLSAAGYLSPKIFRFFQKNGVHLCSGFGMTEATGGITMSPPGEYEEDSVGIPLPGMQTRLGRQNELEISGHYVARYLDDKGPGDDIPFPHEETYWLPTGDLFTQLPGGHFRIVDRIKDIYKNSKGRTVAPRRVENKFMGVPGIKRTFLVGDGRPYNVLFIVPDREDPVLQKGDPNQEADYFHQIVTAANQDLANYERVVNFTLLNRDFSLEKKELTPKGSFQRKTIAQHFSEQIEALYQSEDVELTCGGWHIIIPRWFFRDLGVLETDIQVSGRRLINRSTGRAIQCQPGPESGTVLLGDLAYSVTDNRVNLGLFARQPRLWLGNPSLALFCPVREGWDIPLNNVSPRVLHPRKMRPGMMPDGSPSESNAFATLNMHSQVPPLLASLHLWASLALFETGEAALKAIERIQAHLSHGDPRLIETLRRRLEALAHHPEEPVRCLAYRVLLLDEPSPDYGRSFPTFIQSGKTFLNRESIREIAFSRLENRRLDALRRRMFAYRLQLDWPITELLKKQFYRVFEILRRFADNHPEFYPSVRAELVSWILHRADADLSQYAERTLRELYRRYETAMRETTRELEPKEWRMRIAYEDSLTPAEIQRICDILSLRTFLKQSVILAYDEKSFDPLDIPPHGIWVSPLQSSYAYRRYRVSINTRSGKHFDLQLLLQESGALKESILDDIYQQISVGWYPFGDPVFPRVGCYRPELGALTIEYTGDPTVWEKIRQFSSINTQTEPFKEEKVWRHLFVSAMSAFFRGWHHSGGRIVPGAVNPANVAVPELDFRERVIIVSMSGWKPYAGPVSLVEPMLLNFFQKTVSQYPWTQRHLNATWIFDACLEALGPREGHRFLNELAGVLQKNPVKLQDGQGLSNLLEAYQLRRQHRAYWPQALETAVSRYQNWIMSNPVATPSAREQTILELFRLYRLHRYPEIIRYLLFRHTYFSPAAPDVLEKFDCLISVLHAGPGVPALQRMELSDVQAAISRQEDLDVFSRLVFPRQETPARLDFITIGEDATQQVVIQSEITDKHGTAFTLRDPLHPAEIGQLYRLFFNESFPLSITEQDRYLVVTDHQDRIIGGVVYKLLENQISQLEGTVISPPWRGRGIGSAMVDDFCHRMAGMRVEIIKSPIVFQPFLARHGFRFHRRWGALIKRLPPTSGPAQPVAE